jgi:regulation of enolase protein 1 (concanavalin A-like superfamily)
MLRHLICTFVSLALALPSVVHGFEVTAHGLSDALDVSTVTCNPGSVVPNSSSVCSATPNAGYSLVSFLVNGIDQTAGVVDNGITLADVTSNKTGAAVTPPSVSISTPSGGASYLAPALIPVVATASAGTGAKVSRVDFYGGAMLVGTAFSTPYTITWSGVAAGGYLLSAKVTDSLGATASSADVLVTVTAMTPPYVSLTAPDNLTSYTAPATIPIAAAASAGTGAQVTRVDFFAGATLVGSAAGSPYSFNWSGVGVGTYSLLAKVTDSLGDTATSSDISVTVLASRPVSVSLTSPAPGASYYAPATVQITAAASDGNDATIEKVEFYAGSTLVGTATSAPFNIVWNNVAAGTYSLTAKVTDSLGATATSTQVAISVVVRAPATVAITAPAGGTSYNAPATIQMTAAATAGSGATINKVDFYSGSTLVGTASAAPFSIIWSNVAAGSYPLTAKATDSLGGTATSSPIAVTVSAGAGGQPTLLLTQDIGTVAVKGSASYVNGTYTVKGAGADIWGTSDGFRFDYKAMIGDGEIVARVTSLQNTSPWAKGGVMIRQSLTADSMHAMMDVTPGNGAEFSSRATSGGSTSVTARSNATAPYWVKLVRSGNTFTGYVSSDGTSWEPVGSSTVKMTETVYVGLVECSHSSAPGTATFDNVK